MADLTRSSTARNRLAAMYATGYYLSDVVAGAVLGTVIGHLVTHAP
jgi:hypothetical protein